MKVVPLRKKLPPLHLLGGREGRVPGLRRGLETLEYLQQHPEGAIVAAIAQSLGAPDNSMIRVLNTLSDFGYVERNPHSLAYRLTRKMLRLGLDSAQDRTLLECARLPMRELRNAEGETVIFSVLTDSRSVVLEQIPSIHPFRFVCDPGFSQPLHASASPKAMLAFLSVPERDAYLDGYEFKALTPATITSRAAFKREMAAVARQGYSFDRAEHLESIHCVAAPVLNRSRYPIAAVTLIGASFRLPLSALEPMGQKVRECAQKVAAAYGH